MLNSNTKFCTEVERSKESATWSTLRTCRGHDKLHICIEIGKQNEGMGTPEVPDLYVYSTLELAVAKLLGSAGVALSFGSVTSTIPIYIFLRESGENLYVNHISSFDAPFF